MKRYMHALMVSLLIGFSAPPAEAGVIKKISRDRALVEGEVGEFQQGDPVSFQDDMGYKVGTGTVYKAEGRRYRVRRNSGDMKPNMRVHLTSEAQPAFSESSSQGFGTNLFSDLFSGTENAIIAFGGVALFSDYDETPFVFGGDYAFMRQSGRGWGYRAGFAYWSLSEQEFFVEYELTVWELSAAMEYLYAMDKFLFSAGARFGYALADFTTNFPNVNIDGLDDSSLFLSPFLSASYRLGNTMAIGAEGRSPYYFNNGNFLGDYKLLGSFSYSW